MFYLDCLVIPLYPDVQLIEATYSFAEVEALPWEEMAEALDAYAVCHSIYGLQLFSGSPFKLRLRIFNPYRNLAVFFCLENAMKTDPWYRPWEPIGDPSRSMTLK